MISWKYFFFVVVETTFPASCEPSRCEKRPPGRWLTICLEQSFHLFFGNWAATWFPGGVISSYISCIRVLKCMDASWTWSERWEPNSKRKQSIWLGLLWQPSLLENRSFSRPRVCAHNANVWRNQMFEEINAHFCPYTSALASTISKSKAINPLFSHTPYRLAHNPWPRTYHPTVIFVFYFNLIWRLGTWHKNMFDKIVERYCWIVSLVCFHSYARTLFVLVFLQFIVLFFNSCQKWLHCKMNEFVQNLKNQITFPYNSATQTSKRKLLFQEVLFRFYFECGDFWPPSIHSFGSTSPDGMLTIPLFFIVFATPVVT